MQKRVFGYRLVLVCVLLSSFVPAACAQQRRTRVLAPGVLTVIPTAEQPEEIYSGPTSIVEIVEGMKELDWTPNFDSKSNTFLEKGRNVVFRRTIWNIEFAFKPMRMIEVDVPQPSLKMQRKLVWYMVYRVRNLGYALSPSESEGELGQKRYGTKEVNFKTRRFFPHLVLSSHEYGKEYLDVVSIAAQRAIQEREDPGVRLLNSVEITKAPIPLSTDRVSRSVWGVATWIDIDPRIDFFSVYVRGLTNAFRSEDPPGAFKPGDPPGTGRRYESKALQLNFWRPGDAVLEHEREIRFGVPIDSDPAEQQLILGKYGLERHLDYRWVYR